MCRTDTKQTDRNCTDYAVAHRPAASAVVVTSSPPATLRFFSFLLLLLLLLLLSRYASPPFFSISIFLFLLVHETLYPDILYPVVTIVNRIDNIDRSIKLYVYNTT